jgi:CheY-like chemotaxis protein
MIRGGSVRVETVPVGRALIVDDDEGVRLSLARIIRKAGYFVAFVSTAREAMAAIRAGAPDIIFTDIFMPGADGFELLNWLRRRNCATPLVAMSGANRALTGQLGLASKLGAKAAISKPLCEKDVLEAIEAAVGGQKSPWPTRRSG